MRDKILNEIRRLAEANDGQAPGVRAFETATGISEGTWRGLYWARWSDALAEAGYAANKFQGRSEADHILTSFIEAARHYKRLPTIMELRMFKRQREDFPNEKTIHSYFGSKEGLLTNLRTWLEGKSGFEDIVEMLGPDQEKEASASAKEGLVYLI